jgi:hypothetical protein
MKGEAPRRTRIKWEGNIRFNVLTLASLARIVVLGHVACTTSAGSNDGALQDRSLELAGVCLFCGG